MKRLIAMLAVLTVVAAACAETGAQPLGQAPSDQSSSPTASPTSPSPTPARDVTYEVWFNYDGSLFVTHRTEAFVPAVGALSIESLLQGPTDDESAAGLHSEIQPGTQLLGLTIDDGVATVDLDATFTSQETPAIAVASLSQIVYTLTQFDSIDGVRFEVDGTPLTNFGGYEIDGPQRRADFGDQLPLILVQDPSIGDRVSSPVHISGTADTFEAVVSIAILGEDGSVIASTFTMATCGTGCRGTWETDVEFDVATTQPGMIHVYEVSAMDGSEIHVVDIPVTLAPLS